MQLLARYDIQARWFIPGVTIATYPEICQSIVKHGHEIGHHGWTHTPPIKLSRAEETEELRRANEEIEKLCGKVASGYRSPSWDLSPNTIELLLEHEFVYDSSMMGHDHLPYWTRVGDVIYDDKPPKFGKHCDLLEHSRFSRTSGPPHEVFQRWKTSCQSCVRRFSSAGKPHAGTCVLVLIRKCRKSIGMRDVVTSVIP